jgi:hypothetical protein
MSGHGHKLLLAAGLTWALVACGTDDGSPSKTLGVDGGSDGATPDGSVGGSDATAGTDASQTDSAPSVDAQDAGSVPDSGCAPADVGQAPPKPGEPGWVPTWKDDHGCNYYEHFDPVSGACLSDNAMIQLDEVGCWSHGQVNDFGVGKTCQPGVAECTGMKAGCCHVDDKRYGAICSMYCANSGKVDPACGPGTWCGPMHVCLPAICQGGFSDTQKPKGRKIQTLGLPCDLTSTYNNADGVGTACTTTGEECKNLKATECLGVNATTTLNPGIKSFCSHECLLDADCGDGAACVYFSGKPYFCVPTTCKQQFAGFTITHGKKEASDFPVCNQPPTP